MNPLTSWKLWVAIAMLCRLFWHWVRAAASRTFWTAGRSRPIRTAMIAITTSSSISVNADRRRGGSTAGFIRAPLDNGTNQDDAENKMTWQPADGLVNNQSCQAIVLS